MMINDLDEALRQLLIRELPIKNGEIDIAFDQPKREWSARLNRPTLNLFLYDMRENKLLRGTQPMWRIERQNGNITSKRRRPLRIDLNYLVTAWATEPEDEHSLLSRTLIVMARHPHLPDEVLPETLHDQPVPIPMMVGQEEELRNPADFWGSMDNEWRPAIPCVVTIAVDPYYPITGPLVRTRELRIGESMHPELARLTEGMEADLFWTIGGTLRSDNPLEDIELLLVERGEEVALQPEGRFAIGNLKAGKYTLEVTVKGRKPHRHQVTVPAADYDIEV